MIPEFPQFKKLSLHDKDFLRTFASHYPSYSEFNFVCMFAWDTVQPVMVSILNDNLVVRFVEFRKNQYYYSILGENRLEESIDILLEHSKKEGLEPKLSTIPHATARHLKKLGKYSVEEDKDNHDYILSVNNLVHFGSGEYRGKRNLLNRFTHLYGDRTEYREFDLSDPAVAADVRRVLEKWQPSIPKDSIDIIIEFSAIEKSLKHAKDLDLVAYGSFIDGVLEAFTIFEIVDKKSVIIHFDKANRDFVGIFEHLKHNLGKHLNSLEIELINYGQDMGLEGLRNAKTSYHPVGYLKKYTVKPAPSYKPVHATAPKHTRKLQKA